MPRKNHHNETLNKLKAKLCSDNINISEINNAVKKLIKEQNNIDFYQIENNELKEKLQLLTNSYKNNKTELERYYKVIQKTRSVLEGIVNSNKIDLLQLVDLREELSEICRAVMSDFNIPAAYSTQNNIVFNSFDEALSASEPKISEINEGEENNNNGQIFPSLVRSNRFYDKNNQNFDTDKFKF
ncbi:24739_t:CDS:2 [Gigaspora margarita]|uniref:24739_t:CDS:1 n=1 Tax=Gigaspora margarita TaxID=4874 RepID=A0ABM8W2E8_GIGMA|nr:24739_t:CDS:2 [Gigaspora margarita]